MGAECSKCGYDIYDECGHCKVVDERDNYLRALRIIASPNRETYEQPGDAAAIARKALAGRQTYSPGEVVAYRTYRLGRWWRPTEKAARRMVWGEFGWAHAGDGQAASYRKAPIGYWVTLEQRWYFDAA